MDERQAALAKAMRERGDHNQRIAAWLDTNQGRPSELNTGKEFPGVVPARQNEIPPCGAPVKYLRDAVDVIERSRRLLNEGADPKYVENQMSVFVENLTRNTKFFDDWRLI